MTSPEPNFSVVDRRGRTASGLQVGNLTAEMNRLRQAGVSLPNSPTHARITAKQYGDLAKDPGSLASSTRSAQAQMRRARVANMIRTSADVQVAMPKIREPLGTLVDKGVPIDINNPDELKKARAWARMYYATHDLVPLLIDIYARFPLTGLEFQCFTGETEVITDRGVQRIADLAGGVHRILTTGGRWVEAPFKDFGEAPVLKVTVQRNGRQREIFATKNHRWFIEEHHQKRLGRNSSRWSQLTWEKVDEIRDLAAQGFRHKDIAAQFDVSQPTVSKIVRGHSWTDSQRAADEVRPEPGWHKNEVLTTQLRPGQRLMSCHGRNIIWQVNPSPFGIAAGMVCGDGYKMSNPSRGSSVTLYGEKDANLLPYFHGCTQATYSRPGCSVPGVTITDIPSLFKDKPPLTESTSYLFGWLAGYFAADGTVSTKGEVTLSSAHRGNLEHAQAVCQLLGIHTLDITEHTRDNMTPQGTVISGHTMYRLSMAPSTLTERFFIIPQHRQRWESHKDRRPLESWSVVSVEETDRVEHVYCPQVPGTKAFTLAGNILTGNSDDPKIEKFFTEMFLDDLDYEDFLPNAIGREYFIAGEVTTLGHFDEELGTWASEEVLNPDFVRVSKSHFVDQERVQWMAKEFVDGLRNPPDGESESERMERTFEYQQLLKYHPEIIQAAARDDGLDISEGLWSRLVNRANPWDLRGTPPLMRSFGTLLEEESLRAAQDAVADRLYTPFVLATLGIDDMGDGEPWIPTRDDLDELRNDMQAALMGDFKLYTHHMGLKIENVFGRESMPRLDQDFQRIDMKLMQAWGIGQALIMGGTAAAGTYASSALNREVCELNMRDFQRKAIKHINKRAEVIAEAQRFYAYEKKGSLRVPIYRKVLRFNPETGREEVVRAPKLLIPKVNFRSLNLRDEQTERQFYMDLKNLGVPVSDKLLSINLDADFDLEIKRQAEEQVDKLVAQAEAMAKAKSIIDAKNAELPFDRQMPYPPDMINYLIQTTQLRQQLAAAEMAEGQADMMEQQKDAMSPAGQMGLLPPPPGQGPPPGAAPQQEAGPPPQQGAPGTDEPPLNRARPEVSDEMRAGAPRAARKQAKKSFLESGPSSFGDRFRVSDETVNQEVARREVTARHPIPYVSDLIDDDGFYQMLNQPHLESQIRADYPEIRNGGAKESAELLKEMVQQYEDITGDTPTWD